MRAAWCFLLVALLVPQVAAQFPAGESKPSQVKVSQVTFLLADAVEVAPSGTRMAILAEGLESQKEYGVILVPEVQARWIEVHPVAKPFPPLVVEPYKDNRFLIRGKPGEKFNVSVRGIDIPVWVEVVIAPSAEPEKPPPTEPGPVQPIGDLAKLSRDLAVAMQDAKTQAELKAALSTKTRELKSLCDQNKCPTLDAAKREIAVTIDKVFLARSTPNKDWLKGWRDPVSKAIADKKPATTAAYVSAVLAIVEGL